MAASSQVLHTHLLYGPPALYYLGEMQRRGPFPNLRNPRRVLLSSSKFQAYFFPADIAGSCMGSFAFSAAGQA
jgi:hypothetical protein